MNANNGNDDNLSLTLIKGLQILEKFDSENLDWGVRELGRELKINPSTVYRLTTTLASLGYLEQDPTSRRYSLGPRIMKLASMYMQHNPLPGVAIKVFERYQSCFDYSLYLIALTKKFEAIYLAVSEGQAPLKVTADPGSITALHSTAAGKILLAFQGEQYIKTFLESSDFKRFTSRTITDPVKLEEELRRVRIEGFAINDGEQFEDIGAIAVPVFDQYTQVTSSVSLAYPRHLIKEGRLNYEDMTSCAKEIAQEIMLSTYGSMPKRG